jgi:uncharacterized protein RhaS with RHS repeats
VHDSERRLKSVSANAAPIASYGHDGLGRRVRKTLPDGTHSKYVYGLDGRIAERKELNQPVRETIFVNGHPVAEMVGTPGSTTIRYIHTDHIGLPGLMTDSSGAVIWNAAFHAIRRAGERHGQQLDRPPLPGPARRHACEPLLQLLQGL